jgi:ribonuclease HI
MYDAEMERVVIYTDGGARGNPGPAAAGVVIVHGSKRAEFKKFLGEDLTNNVAEYDALALALAEAKRHGFAGRALDIRMDSELIVKQLSGEYKVKDKTLKVKHADVRSLLFGFPGTTFTHVRREENKDADRLVNEALDEAT